MGKISKYSNLYDRNGKLIALKQQGNERLKVLQKEI